MESQQLTDAMVQYGTSIETQWLLDDREMVGFSCSMCLTASALPCCTLASSLVQVAHTQLTLIHTYTTTHTHTPCSMYWCVNLGCGLLGIPYAQLYLRNLTSYTDVIFLPVHKVTARDLTVLLVVTALPHGPTSGNRVTLRSY